MEAVFLADVCKDWENVVFSMEDSESRVIVLRFGVILDKAGGMLLKILPVFKAGLGRVFCA